MGLRNARIWLPNAKSPKKRYFYYMTDKMAAFTDQVIQALENARLDANMTVNELLRRSGLKRSSYFRKMRGDTELTTGDIDRLARALGRDPMLVLAEAAEQAQAQESINNILEMAAKRGDTEAEQEACEEMP